MTPKTSFEIYRDAIVQKVADAMEFCAIGATGDAKRLQVEIATMHFDGVTPRETHALLRAIDNAVAQIGIALDEATTK